MSRKYTFEEVEYPTKAMLHMTKDALLDAYEGDVVRVMAELERAMLHPKSSSENPSE